ncbi:MAG: alpha/beta fold hydrolase, partial [Rhodanobacter sp.]
SLLFGNLLTMIAQPCVEVPIHFGTGDDLFGLFLASSRRATHAALLCPPFGQDMIRSHRIYRQLARALAAEGVPVLRFDYFGSGDSAGESLQLDWQRCLADAANAATELRSRSGCDTIIAFGARLGGSLAMTASANMRLAKVVAWDPIINGAAYVARQDALQQALQADPNRFMRPRTSDVYQWSGFSVSTGLRQQLTELRITPPTVSTHVLDSGALDAPQRDALLAAGARIAPLSQATPWDDLERIEMAMLSRELVDQASGSLRVVN